MDKMDFGYCQISHTALSPISNTAHTIAGSFILSDKPVETNQDLQDYIKVYISLSSFYFL